MNKTDKKKKENKKQEPVEQKAEDNKKTKTTEKSVEFTDKVAKDIETTSQEVTALLDNVKEHPYVAERIRRTAKHLYHLAILQQKSINRANKPATTKQKESKSKEARSEKLNKLLAGQNKK